MRRTERTHTIAIVGLGLMGGSLGLAIKKRFSRTTVIGVARSRERIRQAVRKKAIDWGDVDFEKVFPLADMIVIATPVSAIPLWVSRANCWSRRGTIVTDVGSVKGEMVAWAEFRNFKNIHYVGAHPMAGSHETGLVHASDGLYSDSYCFVTRTRRSNKEAVGKVVRLWKDICRDVIVLSPRRHDQIVSVVSHLPHAVACLIARRLDPRYRRFVSSGFLDTTRIAQGSPDLWGDIFLGNRVFLKKELRAIRKALGELIGLLIPLRRADLYRFFEKASSYRRALR